ncbi:MAG: DNA topoisomerase IV subunit A, partial [Acholeplasmatales bacterium]|nr:DNA topoisomerase IV subunit A [Acholeplasmatales bacterium]
MAKKENLKNKLDMFQKETFQYERLEDVLGDRFGRYSKAIIQERAIPDVRDGLKPVQRRILYAMNHMKITSTSQYKKSARVCGEVMGKYHPHGDLSIYEAMVRMSQEWRMSVPLIDMQGNNGSIDGDGPAAMRYTESRLSKNADYLLEDIDKNTVPFIDNFDGEEKEPTVLPAKFPNLLVNGSVGISSGYATYIPTHNLAETIDATIYKIDHPSMTIDELLTIMPGPDFPTGGIVQGINGIKEAFLTGAGTVVVKSKISYEDFGDNQKRIVVTEIPFDTNKQKTVERIDQLRIDRKVDGIQEVRDESDRQGLRIAIDLKKGANEAAILNYLLKNTDLQVNLKYNMVVIRNQRPERLGVLQILDAYIDHQKDVITNRTNYLLQKAQDRLHIVEGLIKMVSILDEVIKTIRESKNKADSKDNLVSKFAFSERQAEAIVTMQLYRLSNTDVTALYEEKEALNKSIVEYNAILNSDKKLLKVIKQELVDMKKNIVTPRRTEIQHEISDLTIDEQDLIQKEQNYFVATRDGYLKRVSIKNYNLSKLNTIKEKDTIVFEGEVSTTDVMLGFTNLGSFVYIPIFKVDECKMKDIGSYINNIATISPIEKLIRVFIISKFDDKTNVLLTTKNGLIKQTKLSDFVVSRYTKDVRAMKLQD